MKNSLSDAQKLVALTAFLTQKILLLAGSAFFEDEAADLDAVSQKRSQIDRLTAELTSQITACSLSSSTETSRAAVLRTLGQGLQAISHDAEALAQAVSGWNRPDDDILQTLHSLYEASAILIAQAIGALVDQSNLNLHEAAHNLCRNQAHLADMETGIPSDDHALPVVLPVRNISRHARRMAETVHVHLAPNASMAGSLLPDHLKN